VREKETRLTAKKRACTRAKKKKKRERERTGEYRN
jgi:hypothetical protein